LVKEFECEVCVYDDFASVLADGFFDDAVFVALGCEVADSEEVADSFESIDESSGRFGCRCVFCSVADGGADTFVKELDEFLYCQGIEGPVVKTSHCYLFLRKWWFQGRDDEHFRLHHELQFIGSVIPPIRGSVLRR
jgi:hypothetical protein